MTLARGSIRGISFDYGHVLGALDLDELSARLGGVDASLLRAAQPAAFRAHDEAIARGSGHENAWRALMTTLVGASNAPVDVASTVEQLWQAQPTRNLWRFVPDEARKLLDDLTAARVPMVVTSNSEGRAAELLEEVGIAHHFSKILDSGLLGFGKPDRRIFELAAAALSLPIDQIVHIGDSEAADVIGAKEAGMRAIRFDGFVPGNTGRPTSGDAVVITFDSLREVLLGALSR